MDYVLHTALLIAPVLSLHQGEVHQGGTLQEFYSKGLDWSFGQFDAVPGFG